MFAALIFLVNGNLERQKPMENNKILIVGDIHGRFNHLNQLINKKHPKELWSTGDFGYWPNFKINGDSRKSETSGMYNTNNGIKYTKSKELRDIKPQNSIIHWCDGNHEDHDMLEQRVNDEIQPNVFYQPRGSVTTLPDRRKVLWMGGADSIDKGCRTPGWDWFPQEIISQRDFMALPDTKIDIVISHTCPTEFLYGVGKSNPAKINDPCCEVLSKILKIYHPSLYFFSHWHTSATGFTKDCRWFCLDMCNYQGWWMELPK